MLRSTPSTLLVCLAFFVSILLTGLAAAADPQEALDVLLKPNDVSASSAVKAPKTKTRSVAPPRRYAYNPPDPNAPMPAGITKVKPVPCAWDPVALPCILPQPLMRQWDMSLQVIWARTKGRVAWPRWPWSGYGGYWWGQSNEIDLNNDLGLPEHRTPLEFKARYQFRPNWALRYSVFADQLSGGKGWWWDYSGYTWFQFGPMLIQPGQPYQSKWTYSYQRVGLIYDAIKTPMSVLSVFADWAHTEDRVELSCSYCATWSYNAVLSKSNDMAVVGLEYQRCLQTYWNGGTFSCDYKAGFMFLDDSEGWDLSAAMRYSIPVNCGRWGYVKGGYRYISIKKAQQDLLLSKSLDGGFMEFGFIF